MNLQTSPNISIYAVGSALALRDIASSVVTPYMLGTLSEIPNPANMEA